MDASIRVDVNELLRQVEALRGTPEAAARSPDPAPRRAGFVCGTVITGVHDSFKVVTGPRCRCEEAPQ